MYRIIGKEYIEELQGKKNADRELMKSLERTKKKRIENNQYGNNSVEKNPKVLYSYENKAKNKLSEVGPFEVEEKCENEPKKVYMVLTD